MAVLYQFEKESQKKDTEKSLFFFSKSPYYYRINLKGCRKRHYGGHCEEPNEKRNDAAIYDSLISRRARLLRLARNDII